MRLRSLALPTVLAIGAAVLAPAPARAAVQCGMIVPTKVVVDATVEQRPVTLTSGCWDNAADHANWRYQHASGAWFDVDVTAEDLDGSSGRDFGVVWNDDDPMGRYALTPTGSEQIDGDPLTQNSAVTYVKYHSRLETTVTRTGAGLSWKATPYQWSGRSHEYVKRRGVSVGLFHQASSTAPWKYVRGALALNASGAVYFSVGTAQAGNYRLVVAETPTVWASYSPIVKGRV